MCVCLDGPQDLSDKPFFGGLVGYITSGPVVCIALEGDGVVASARKMIGATKPLGAEPGTIRGDLAIEVEYNAKNTMSNCNRQCSISSVKIESMISVAKRKTDECFGRLDGTLSMDLTAQKTESVS